MDTRLASLGLADDGAGGSTTQNKKNRTRATTYECLAAVDKSGVERGELGVRETQGGRSDETGGRQSKVHREGYWWWRGKMVAAGL